MSIRYFVGIGQDAEVLKERVLGAITEQRARQVEVAKKYGADRFYVNRDGQITQLAFRSPDEEFPIPVGLRSAIRSHMEGGYEHCVVPDLRTKVGRSMTTEFRSIPKVNGSDLIVKHYDAARHTVVPHAGRTGMAMAISVGGIVKGQIVISVPVDESDPFEPDERLREIKKSEYIALTEE